ncbi:MAG: hypothetical protein U5K54_17640 [Cytophagales bacterium]|nr:hypothetical protein [Cytophagales bacterium]
MENKTEDIDKLTSGRTMIVYLDWQIFKDNPVLGVGVGMGKELRKNMALCNGGSSS